MKEKMVLRAAVILALAAVFLIAAAPQAGELEPGSPPNTPEAVYAYQWTLAFSTYFAIQWSLVSPPYSAVAFDSHLWQFCFGWALYNPCAPPNRMDKLNLPKDPERPCGGENGCIMVDMP